MTARTKGDGLKTTRTEVTVDLSSASTSPCQVSCGATHTLVLRNNKLWVLGSGLDLKPRASNLVVVKKKLAGLSKPSTFLEPNGCFSPRKLDMILSDSTEFSCQTGPFYRENYSQEVKELTVGGLGAEEKGWQDLSSFIHHFGSQFRSQKDGAEIPGLSPEGR